MINRCYDNLLVDFCRTEEGSFMHDPKHHTHQLPTPPPKKSNNPDKTKCEDNIYICSKMDSILYISLPLIRQHNDY